MRSKKVVALWSHLPNISKVFRDKLLKLNLRFRFYFSEEKSLNIVKCFRLVPRAGLEPARPILSNPRILSPGIFFHNLFQSLTNQILGTNLRSHSGRTFR